MPTKRKATSASASTPKPKRTRTTPTNKASTKKNSIKKEPLNEAPPSKTLSRSTRKTRSENAILGSFFNDLPYEIRDKIYTAYFQLADLKPNCHRGCPPGCCKHDKGFGSLLAVSRQMHEEIWPHYASHRTFIFSEPMDLANNFLSFLPKQRLLSLKHLSLHNNNEVHRDLFLEHLEKTWWYYLDVFSNLETFTLEATRNSFYEVRQKQAFYAMAPVLVRLLEQGHPKKAQWASRQSYEQLKIQSKNLPPSHDWVMQIGIMTKTIKGRYRPVDSFTSHRIVIKRHRDLDNNQHARMFGKWPTWTETKARPIRQKISHHIFAPDLFLDDNQISTLNGRVNRVTINPTAHQHYEPLTSIPLGPDTKVVATERGWVFSHFSTRKVVALRGRWSNKDDLL